MTEDTIPEPGDQPAPRLDEATEKVEKTEKTETTETTADPDASSDVEP